MCFVFFLLISGNVLTAKPCQAASAKVELSSEASEVTVGDVFTVNVLIDSDTVFGDFEANLSYDEDILEYQGGATEISGSSGFLKISDLGVTRGSSKRNYSMKFEASQVGNCEIVFKDRVMVYDFNSGDEMSISSNRITIQVKAKETASENANLKSLKTSPSELIPGFDKNIYQYSLSVGYDTEQLVIDAIPENTKASVVISGNDSLKEGENKISIKVIAESRAVIEYNINVNRASATEDVATSENTGTISQDEKGSFEVVLIEGLTYAVLRGNYQLIQPGNDVIIPIGYIKSKLIISDIAVTAYTPEDNLESDFLLIYAKNEQGEEGFYRYDRVEKTLQRYIFDEQLPIQEQPDTDDSDKLLAQEYHDKLNKAAVAIALLGAVSALLLVIIVRLVLKLRGYREEDLD